MRTTENKETNKKLYFSILIASIGILFLLSISLSMGSQSDSVSMTVFPTVPKEGMPLLITINLNNPTQNEDEISYELYGNGKLLIHGSLLLPKISSEQLIYVYPESPKEGERVTFLLKTKSAKGDYLKTISLPAYPPQVWSSFVSFASFSTSLMGSSMGTSITSWGFYDSTFVESSKFNVGLTFSIVLIIMLVFLELTDPLDEKGFRILGLRLRFSRFSIILFAVFIGMVLTRIVMIIR